MQMEQVIPLICRQPDGSGHRPRTEPAAHRHLLLCRCGATTCCKTGNRNPQKLAHVMENVRQQAQRAGDVIKQLMTVLHKGETISEPININNSVHDALDFVKAADI